MTDFIFFAQILVLILNCVVFVFLMQTENINYKLARIVLLVAISVGTVINFGKVTVCTILFSFAPFLSLININQHGKIHRLIERIRDFIGGHQQPLQKL